MFFPRPAVAYVYLAFAAVYTLIIIMQKKPEWLRVMGVDFEVRFAPYSTLKQFRYSLLSERQIRKSGEYNLEKS